MTTQERIFAAIRAERQRQDEKWGPDHDPGDGVLLAVLLEEVGEVATELIGRWPEPAWPAWVKAELIQVAAVCVRWLELLEEDIGRQSGIR